MRKIEKYLAIQDKLCPVCKKGNPILYKAFLREKYRIKCSNCKKKTVKVDTLFEAKRHWTNKLIY